MQNKHYGNIHLCDIGVYSQNSQPWPTEKNNVPLAFILPSKWQDGTESLGIGRDHYLFMIIVIVAKCKQDSKVPTYFAFDGGIKMHGYSDWSVFLVSQCSNFTLI